MCWNSFPKTVYVTYGILQLNPSIIGHLAFFLRQLRYKWEPATTDMGRKKKFRNSSKWQSCIVLHDLTNAIVSSSSAWVRANNPSRMKITEHFIMFRRRARNVHSISTDVQWRAVINPVIYPLMCTSRLSWYYGHTLFVYSEDQEWNS